MIGADRHHRHSIRLRGHDYAQAGAYFVTICTQDRACLFGEIVDGVMRLSDAGAMVQGVWEAIPGRYPGVDVDGFVVMPNHVHGIVVIAPADQGQARDDQGQARDDQGQAQGPAPTGATVSDLETGHRDDADVGAAPRGRPVLAPMSLGDVVHRFKSMTTNRYADGVRDTGWPAFRGRLWQRNYYEHIVRDDDALNRIRQYIRENPARWASDRENPAFGL